MPDEVARPEFVSVDHLDTAVQKLWTLGLALTTMRKNLDERSLEAVDFVIEELDTIVRYLQYVVAEDRPHGA